MKSNSLRLAGDDQHTAVIGRNGSGKTVAALWHLSKRNFESMPWIVVDFKRDEHINAIERAQYIGVDEKIPKHPGVYIVQPDPSDPRGLADMFEKAYNRENVGFWIDEGFMMGENREVEKKFIRLLVQGRSKRIPFIVLVQRPTWITRFVFSESNFFQIFHLQDARDVDTITRVLPAGSYFRMPDFHSVYFDVSQNTVHYLRPVPQASEIIDSINERLPKHRRTL